MLHPTDRIALTRIAPVVEQWLEREIVNGSVLFNDALNTFYLRLYGKGPFR